METTNKIEIYQDKETGITIDVSMYLKKGELSKDSVVAKLAPTDCDIAFGTIGKSWNVNVQTILDWE